MTSLFSGRRGSQRPASDASNQSILSHNRTNSSTNSRTRPGKFESLDNFAEPLMQGSICKVPEYRNINAGSIPKRGQIIHIQYRPAEGDSCTHIHDRIVLILSYDVQAARCLPFCYHEDESHVDQNHANVVTSRSANPVTRNAASTPDIPHSTASGAARQDINETALEAANMLFQAYVNLRWAREFYKPKQTTYLNMSETWRIEFTGVEFAILGAIDDSCWREVQLRAAEEFIKSLELRDVDLVIRRPSTSRGTSPMPEVTTRTSGQGGREERRQKSDHNNRHGGRQKEDRSPKAKDHGKHQQGRSSDVKIRLFGGLGG